MKKILLSLGIISAVAAVMVGATGAYLKSQATVDDNTVSTGTLEIRVNGEPAIAGFTMSNVAPGDCKSGQFGVNNYGAPYFAGLSTLAAKELVISAAGAAGDTNLYNALTIKVEANRGWATWMPVYNGPLTGLSEEDLLTPNWTDLIAGSSEDVRYEVCLPNDPAVDQSSLMGKSTNFDFVVDAYNPHR